MNGDDDDNLSGWLDAMDEEQKESGPEGPSGEVVRSAMQINPRLAEKGEKAVRQEVEAAQRSEKKSDLFADAPNTGINLTLASVKQRFGAEQKRLKGRIGELKAQLPAIPARYLEKVIAAVLAYDPEMAKPETLRLLDEHRKFLDAIGFSARKVIDAERRRR